MKSSIKFVTLLAVFCAVNSTHCMRTSAEREEYDARIGALKSMSDSEFQAAYNAFERQYAAAQAAGTASPDDHEKHGDFAMVNLYKISQQVSAAPRTVTAPARCCLYLSEDLQYQDVTINQRATQRKTPGTLHTNASREEHCARMSTLKSMSDSEFKTAYSAFERQYTAARAAGTASPDDHEKNTEFSTVNLWKIVQELAQQKPITPVSLAPQASEYTEECPICLLPLEDRLSYTLHCRHTLCDSCDNLLRAAEMEAHKALHMCPLCRATEPFERNSSPR